MKSGVFFFTDPPYGFKKFDEAAEKEIAFNGVYRAGTDGKITAIEKDLHRPNGVALSPDESVLYVAQSEPTKAIIMAYSLDAAGNVTGKKLFHDFTDLIGDAARAARRDGRGGTARSSPPVRAAFSFCRRTASASGASGTARPPPTASLATMAGRFT